MLGRIHGSIEHFYVPRLIHLDEKAQVGSIKQGPAGAPTRSYNLYKLDWESVDAFKRDYYIKWVEDHWKEKFPKALEGRFPATLPERYDSIIKGMLFALPHDSKVEIEHFAQIYYTERHRVRHFDTVIREMCLEVSEAAIGCAFKLLGDCIYDPENKTWFRDNREIDKHLARHLMMYKFWREATGRGCVWEHAEMDKLERQTAFLEKEPYRTTLDTVRMYRRCLGEIRQWEEDQEKFHSFLSLPVDKASGPSLGDGPPELAGECDEAQPS